MIGRTLLFVFLCGSLLLWLQMANHQSKVKSSPYSNDTDLELTERGSSQLRDPADDAGTSCGEDELMNPPALHTDINLNKDVAFDTNDYAETSTDHTERKTVLHPRSRRSQTTVVFQCPIERCVFGSCYVAKPAVHPTGKAFWILQDKKRIQLETGGGKTMIVTYTLTLTKSRP